MKKLIVLAAIAVALIQFSQTSATPAKKPEKPVSSEQLNCDELAKRLTVANRHHYIQNCL